MAKPKRLTAAQRAQAELKTLDSFLREYGVERGAREKTSVLIPRILIDYQARVDELNRELRNAQVQLSRYAAERELVKGPVSPEDAPDERMRATLQTLHAFGYASTTLRIGDVEVSLHPRHMDRPRDPDELTFASADDED